MDLFNKIIDYGLRAKTSDIHLGVGYKPTIRRDGRMSQIKDFPALTGANVDAIVKHLLDDKQYQKLLQSQEIDLSFTYQDKARFRVNIYKERKGINLALRYIPGQIPSFDDLGMPDILKKLVAYPYGLILVTGPTGSGKSTTLAAMIDHINQITSQHIITIEDPIEYIHQNKKCLIKQREVGEGEDSRSFPQALRAVLREDPDVILVGEMRDRETMALAITAAETGHLVLSSVHTNNTYQAINRIIDVFPAKQQDQIRIQLAQNLIAIIAQRLLPKRGGGRIAAFEILINNSAIKTQIKENKIAGIPNTIKTHNQEGMVLLQDYIQGLAAKGLVDPEVSYRFLGSQAAY